MSDSRLARNGLFRFCANIAHVPTCKADNVPKMFGFVPKTAIQLFLRQIRKTGTFHWNVPVSSCRTRIRTSTNRTKTCCAAITPYDNPDACPLSGTAAKVPNIF